MKLVLASNNKGKLAELQALFAPLGVELVRQADLGIPEAPEPHRTFIENALAKARHASAVSGLPALADDSGLCVAALNGAPGVYTADWAERQPYEGPAGRDWYMAMGKVEGKLAELGPDIDRSAYFNSTLALAWPDGHVEIFEGRAEGRLTWPPRGTMGFGYDPIFILDGKTQTFAEIPFEEKHKISHRTHAFAKLVAAVF